MRFSTNKILTGNWRRGTLGKDDGCDMAESYNDLMCSREHIHHAPLSISRHTALPATLLARTSECDPHQEQTKTEQKANAKDKSMVALEN